MTFVTLGKSCDLSEPQSPHLQNGKQTSEGENGELFLVCVSDDACGFAQSLHGHYLV